MFYTKPSKSVLIVHLNNTEAGKLIGLRHVFKVCTGARYLGRYIGDEYSKHDWLKECMDMWEQNIFKISETVGKRPQESYTAVVCVIISEWILLQCVTMDTGDAFAGV